MFDQFGRCEDIVSCAIDIATLMVMFFLVGILLEVLTKYLNESNARGRVQENKTHGEKGCPKK